MIRPFSIVNKTYAWLDERTGIKRLVRRTLDEPIRGGARWSYVFGSALLLLFVIQALTGIFLTMYYVPSADHAHVSVAYIQKAVPGGALIRGLHYYGASGMVLLLIAHLTQTFVFGAYKKKRELLWIVGGVLFLLTLCFAFTGQLLPWDQEAYFGTKVGTSIAGEIPVVGHLQQRIILGGPDITSSTLSRFFMAHVFLLPLALGFLVLLHVYLFRHAGAAGPFDNREHRADRFYPKQLFKDSFFFLLVFVALVTVATLMPAALGPQAKPGSDFLARPAWYFLPLFQLLKYFPGRLTLIPTLLLPGFLFTLLFLLPFFDRRHERHPLRRPVATTALALVLIGSGSLVFLAKYQDKTNPEYNAKLQHQEELARIFLKAQFRPQEVGASAVRASSSAAGSLNSNAEPPKEFLATCALCHGDNGEGNDLGPPLQGVTAKPNRTRDDLLRILDNPPAYGLKDPMPVSFPDLSADDKRLIVDWLINLNKQDSPSLGE
ncbi:MAG: cytochrome b N-terminal domain-containing protein [Pyrinomonadaceae bacterium]|nr:cytochrome b N-terminal domain-containing protein [Pyrinomonadaceae bacterium]